jgi:isopenicillin N synthase-like dioxygenase
MNKVPVIDVSNLRANPDAAPAVAREIGSACRDVGFFYIVGHGISLTLQQELETLSQRFFALSEPEKLEIAMDRGGRAWRGYFPVGGELTSGKPDVKEGIYFGIELGPDHPMVKAKVPLHGANLFPRQIPELKKVVLEYMQAMTELGHILMAGIAQSLDLEADYFARRYTADPLTLFRIFNYPVPAADSAELWGVGEHTDYGVLTILKQDASGGLEVKTALGWLAAPPIANAFVCNIGDMLDRMTGGYYRSTPHRVRNASGRQRLSYPFFFDPNFNVEVKAIDFTRTVAVVDDREQRWDKASVHDFQGTYGDYLLGKVAKVFPDLDAKVKTHTEA